MAIDDTGSIDSGEKVVDNPVLDCSRPEITTKYRAAADIVNEVLKTVVEACKPDQDIATLCKLGDDLIEAKVEKIYCKKEKGEKIRRGIAYPTTITPNELCSGLSPLVSESLKLKEGDVVKIELGCHIDGFIAVAAHTIVLEDKDVKGRKADVVRAAWTAAEAAVRTIKVGRTNKEVTKIMNKSVEQFNCKMVESIHSHQLKQHVIDGVRSILSKETVDEKSDNFEFELNEVYGVDVVVTTGDGKLRETEIRTTVFKRDVEVNYSLKTPLARQFLRETNARFPLLPFSARAIENEKVARSGVLECSRHGLVQPYPILTERQGEIVAQFKFTVMLLAGGTKKVTGLPFTQDAIIKSDFTVVDEELKALLATSVRPKKKKVASSDKKSVAANTQCSTTPAQ